MAHNPTRTDCMNSTSTTEQVNRPDEADVEAAHRLLCACQEAVNKGLVRDTGTRTGM